MSDSLSDFYEFAIGIINGIDSSSDGQEMYPLICDTFDTFRSNNKLTVQDAYNRIARHNDYPKIRDHFNKAIVTRNKDINLASPSPVTNSTRINPPTLPFSIASSSNMTSQQSTSKSPDQKQQLNNNPKNPTIDGKPATKSDTQSATKSDTQSATKSDTQTATKSSTQSATKSDTQTATKSSTQTATKSSTQSATKSDTQSTTKSDTQTTKSDTQTATKSDLSDNNPNDDDSDWILVV